MIKRTVHLAAPAIGDEEWYALKDVLESGWLTQGPKVAELERRFAKRHGVGHAVAVSSCTAGLHVALVALGIGPGDEVIVPAFTWVATANAVLQCGAKPVFVDIDCQTFNLDPARIAAKLSPQTKAIVPVHLFGLCADIDAVRASVPSHVRIVEDAACAAGAAYRGRPAGDSGTSRCFRFIPASRSRRAKAGC